MGSSTKLWVARRAAEVGVQVLKEKVRPPVPRTRDDVPANGDDLTVEWLTAVLCADVSGAQVTSFDIPGGERGTSTRTALRVTYNEAGTQAGLPTALFTKTTATFAQRLMLGAGRLLEGEPNFFTIFRPQVEMETPKGYFCGVDQKSWRSIVLMEDIAATRGATFTAPVTPLTRAQVEDVLATMAAYHGTWWNRPELSVLKTPNEHIQTVASMIGVEANCKRGMERAKAVIPPGVYGQADRLWKGTLRCLEIATHDIPPTLLHGDTHIGNTYITADGRMGLTDWQTTMQGGWAYDVAYLITSSCEPDDRRAWDKELLELYLGQLADAGGDAPAFDNAWLRYRQLAVYTWVAWAGTIGRAFYQPHMQPDEYSLAILRRATAAIDDLKSFEALGV